MLDCPKCFNTKSKVLTTITTDFLGMKARMRVRRCEGCGGSYKTAEVTEKVLLESYFRQQLETITENIVTRMLRERY